MRRWEEMTMPMELQSFDNLKDDLTNMASNLEFGAGVNRAH